MPECVFCKIASGDIPSQIIYEDSEVMAFLDIAPVNPGHTLVISKEHFANLEEIEENILIAMIKTAKRIGQALKKGLKVEGFNIQINNDPVAGQVIPHIHFHIIPRKKGDNLELWPQGKYATGEAEKILGKIKSGL